MARFYCRLSAVVVLVFIASLSLTALAGADGTQRKIVVFEAGLNEAAKQSIIKGAGAVGIKALPLINGYAVSVPAQGERSLQRPGVLRVDDDLVVRAIGKPSGGKPGGSASQPVETLTWGVGRISAPAAWSTSRGAGVKVAVLDTGISTSHPDLKVWGGTNAINPRKSYNDDNGHGSHVAGTIAATDNEIGVIGVAPEARLFAVKVLNANGSGYLSDIIEGLDWSIANGMNVVNMSLGSDTGNQSFYEAILRAYNAGITIVAAAGNDGPYANSVDYPAAYAEVIAVSASNQSDGIPSWSSRGPEVDVAAPGAGILSTYKGSGYATGDGTSMAAPHVAGVVALRIAVDPGQSPAYYASVLKNSADTLGLAAVEEGTGLADAAGAVTWTPAP